MANNESEKKNNGKETRKGPSEVVFLLDGGTVKMVAVETGISDDNYIEIKEGLEDSLDVVSGSYRAISRELEDGSTVKVEEKRKGGRDRDE